MNIKLSEEFESIVGEGYYTGMPAYFIRLYGCNLNCSWCDSKYARNGDFYEDTTESVAKRIERSSKQFIVITGGEPLIQKKAINDLVDKVDGKIFTLETNGTISPANVSERIFMTVSPKKNSGFAFYIDEYIDRVSVFKFVVDNTDPTCWTVEEVKALAKSYDIPSRDIWLMPKSTAGYIDNDVARDIWSKAVENNMNYSDRLQVRVFGMQRRV